MYAIIEDGGKQYRVNKGDTLYIEQRDMEGSREVQFDRVLMLGDGKDSRIGTPVIEGARVTARLEEEVRGPKLDIVKFRRRKGYRLKKGHRQNLMRVVIDEIHA